MFISGSSSEYGWIDPYSHSCILWKLSELLRVGGRDGIRPTSSSWDSQFSD